jgi:hypothetical protein
VPIGGAAAEEGGDASSALGLDEVDDDGMDEATRAAIACAYEGESGAWKGGEGGGAWSGGGAGGGWLSGLSAAATQSAADEEEDAAEDDGDWELRGLRLPVGARVFVDEGTKGGVSGRRAVPFFVAILSNRSGCRYGVKSFEAQQHE